MASVHSSVSRKVSDSMLFGFNRPREMEEMKPVKEPLHFEQENIPKEMLPAMMPLLELARSELWHWKIFPIILPKPITVQTDQTNGSASTSMSKKKTIKIRDLFVEPDFHELDAVATDSKGEPKKLNQAQLECIQRIGEFQVDSVQFSGQKHTWKLTTILQKGSDRSTETLYQDLSYALQFIVVIAKECLVGPMFSVRESVNHLSEGLMNLFDIIIGIPLMEIKNLELRLHEERVKYLVCELKCPLENSVDKLVDFARNLIRRQTIEKGGLVEGKNPLVTFIFQSPQGVEIDLRLCSKEVMSRSKPVLMKILESESHGWFPEFKEKVVTELKSQQLSRKEVESEANERITTEFLRRVCDAIMKDNVLASIGKDINLLLVNQLKACVFSQQALERTEHHLSEALAKEEHYLRDQFPIRSKIRKWLSNRLIKAKESYIIANQWTAHQLALESCKRAGLVQHAYFLSRDLSYLRDQEPVLEMELSNSELKTPSHNFEFKIHTWNPKHWVVSKHYGGKMEIIPTVINSSPIRQTSLRRQNSELGDKPVFLVQKDTILKNDTRNYCWRWVNFCKRTWCWFWNFLFLFLIVLPWCSPYSFKALFLPYPFVPDYEVSQTTGILHKKTSSTTPTFLSRLLSLWRHISKSRTDFESMPDRGLFGKTLLRYINYFTNYIIKGLFGSILILMIFPFFCLFISCGSILLAIMGPVLVPVCSFLFHIFCIIFYDFETGDPLVALFPSLTLNIILGIFQPFLCLLISFILCPLAASAISLWALIKKGFRCVWDSAMFRFVISVRARVPANDSFVAKRTSGPGMASNFFYQIKTEQALVALEAKMEMAELEAYKEQLSALINSPVENYRKFIANTMRPLCLSLNKNTPGPYQQLDKEVAGLLSTLKEKVDQRVSQLKLVFPETMKKRIKLSERELKLSLSRGAAMVQAFYPEHIIARLKGGSIKFWTEHGLKEQNWIGLTSSLYSEIFSPEFLTPMQEADTTFHLKVEHWNLTRYLNMVLESDWHDDLDVARAIHSPKGNLDIQSPYLDSTLFNPLATSGTHLINRRQNKRRWRILKNYQANLLPHLCVPLPIPHPAEVCLIIYNRDSDNPISIESCRPIIRELREMSQPLSAEYLSCHAHEDPSPDSESLSGDSLQSRDVEGEQELASLTGHSLEHLERGLIGLHLQEKPVRVQIRSQSVVEVARPMIAKYTVRSESNMAPKMKGSVARIASQEDCRIDEQGPAYSTVV